MSLLIAGVVAWSVAHLFPCVLPGTRKRLQTKLGEGPYRGLFSLVIVGSLVLIVVGWKSAVPSVVYAPPLNGNIITGALILIGFVLFFSSQVPGNVRRYIRHPQMASVRFWGIAHLLTNGDSRSLVLFGGLTIWSIIEVLAISRRDGEWQKPEPAAMKFDLITVLIGSAAFAAVVYFHATVFGVSAFPT